MEKCPTCPLRESDRPCIAFIAGPRICVLADPDSPEHNPAWIKAVDDRSPGGRDCQAVNAAPAAAPVLTVAESLALVAAMKACPDWRPSSECGCGVNLCLAGKGKNGEVSRQDCFGCLSQT